MLGKPLLPKANFVVLARTKAVLDIFHLELNPCTCSSFTNSLRLNNNSDRVCTLHHRADVIIEPTGWSSADCACISTVVHALHAYLHIQVHGALWGAHKANTCGLRH